MDRRLDLEPAIYCSGGGSPTITNCTMRGPRLFGTITWGGGGIVVNGVTPQITGCEITGLAINGTAAIRVYNGGNAAIRSCWLHGNSGSGLGGGVACTAATVSVADTRIEQLRRPRRRPLC